MIPVGNKEDSLFIIAGATQEVSSLSLDRFGGFVILLNRLRTLAIVGLLSLGVSFAPQVHATTYTDLVVFGDSLSDSGNVFDLFGGVFGPNPPYAEHRFTGNYTNGDPGLVWVEHLATLMGLSLDNSLAGGTNYAFGFARATEDAADLIPSLPDQLNFYMVDTGGTADANALYVVFGGGSDVRDNDIGASVASIGSVITDLAAAGAVSFLVPTLHDIGLTPESQAGLAPGGSAEVISLAVATYNAGLSAEVAALEASLGVNIITFDLFGLLNIILTDPTAFGIVNVTDACAGIDVGGDLCADPDSYLFFDGIHPTAIVHQTIAEFAFAQIDPAAGQDSDGDGISNFWDRLPFDDSNANCTTNDGTNATLVGATVTVQQTCAAKESVDVSGTTNVGIDGNLRLISEKVSLTEMSVTDNGRLEVINADPCPGCNPTVFVTSTIYNGDLGGLEGADEKCQTRATAAGLPGTWVAWLSTGSVDAKDRIDDTTYELPNGVVVANDLTDLTDSALANPIQIDEYKQTLSGNLFVWTGTRPNGTKYGVGFACDAWTTGTWDGVSLLRGYHGKASATDAKWTDVGQSFCNGERHLYCFAAPEI